MSLEHAIMAFLEFSPMTGYDLKKYFDQSVAHFYPATQSHIYKALTAMLKKGWLLVEHIEQTDKPNRKVYHLTGLGKTELANWMITPLPLNETREAWLVQIFFGHFQSNEQIIALLENRKAQLEDSTRRLKEEAQSAVDANAAHIGVPRATALWQFTLDYGLAMQECDIAWLEKAIEAMRSLPPLTPPLYYPESDYKKEEK